MNAIHCKQACIGTTMLTLDTIAGTPSVRANLSWHSLSTIQDDWHVNAIIALKLYHLFWQGSLQLHSHPIWRLRRCNFLWGCKGWLGAAMNSSWFLSGLVWRYKQTMSALQTCIQHEWLSWATHSKIIGYKQSPGFLVCSEGVMSDHGYSISSHRGFKVIIPAIQAL